MTANYNIEFEKNNKSNFDNSFKLLILDDSQETHQCMKIINAIDRT